MRSHLPIALLLLLTAIRLGAQDAWQLAKSKDDIEVYTRSTEGSDIKEFKAQTIVQAQIGMVEALLDDVASYTEWQANTSESEIVKTLDKSQFIMYIRTDVPWPGKDRDLVLLSRKERGTDGSVKYLQESRNDILEENDQAIRITDAAGQWRLTPLDSGEVEVFYTFFADPAGSMPDWIVNMFIVDGPYKTLRNMKERIGR